MRIITLLLAIFLCTGVLAQVKQTHITEDYVSVKYRVGSAVEKFGKEKTFKVVVPLRLKYHNEDENKKRWDYFEMSMDAKFVKNDVPADKTFEISTDGLMALNKFKDIRWTFPANPGVQGWVRIVYYNFPLKVLVKNGLGVIEKELIISGPQQEKNAIFHADMFTDDASNRDGVRDAVPFKTQEELQKAFDQNKVAVEKRMERNEVLRLYPLMNAAVYAGYDFNKFSKSTLYFYILKKNEKANFASIDQTTEKFGLAIKDFQDETKQSTALEALNNCYVFYKTQLDATGNLPVDVVKLCLFNGAVSALFTGNIDDANKWFSNYYINYRTNGNSSMLENSNETFFFKLYSFFMPYYAYKDPKDIMVNMDKHLTAYEDQGAAIEAAKEVNAQQAKKDRIEIRENNPNLIGAAGYLVLLNGEKIEGDISINFLEDKEYGIAEIDLGAIVTIQKTNGYIENIKIGNIAYFVAKGNRYDALKVNESTVLGVLNKVTGDPYVLHFYKQYYVSGDYTVAQDPRDEKLFIIRKAGNDKAVKAADILKNRKIARDFIESCPALKQKAEQKEGFEDIKDVKQLADFLNGSCK